MRLPSDGSLALEAVFDGLGTPVAHFCFVKEDYHRRIYWR